MEENSVPLVLNKLSEVNIKDVERATKIPADRMYKWLKGKGAPKIGDLTLLTKYFKIVTNSNINSYEIKSNENITEEHSQPKGLGFESPEKFNRKEIYTHNSMYPDRDVNGNTVEKDVTITLKHSELEKLKKILVFANEHLPFSNATSREVQTVLPQIKEIYNKLNS